MDDPFTAHTSPLVRELVADSPPTKPINAPYPEIDCPNCDEGGEPCPQHNARVKNQYRSWAVCAVDPEGKPTHYTSDEEGQAKAWAIYWKQSHPDHRIVIQHGVHRQIYQLLGEAAFAEDGLYLGICYTWAAVDVKMLVHPPRYKVETSRPGIGAAWYLGDRTEAIAFGMSQKNLSPRTIVTLTEPDGKAWLVEADGRLLETGQWILTTDENWSPPSPDAVISTSFRDYSECLAAALHHRKKNPCWRITVTDPAGVERELKLEPAWLHVEPGYNLIADPIYGDRDHPASKWQHVFRDWSGR